ncbi:MAG: hypothetical protein ACXWTU_01275, partial [Methylotenera sp.]
MQEEDIPLLTEVHASPAQPIIKPVNITADLIAEIISQIKPQLKLQLEDEIEKSITQKLRKKMHDELIDNLRDESANIQKASLAYLSSALDRQFEQKSQLLEQKSELIQGETEATLKQYVSNELAAAQHASHASLSDALNAAIE